MVCPSLKLTLLWATFKGFHLSWCSKSGELAAFYLLLARSMPNESLQRTVRFAARRLALALGFQEVIHVHLSSCCRQ